MKQNIPPGVFIALIAVVLVAVVVFGWRMLFPDPNYTPIQGEAAEKAYDQRRADDRETLRRVREQQARGVPPDQIK